MPNQWFGIKSVMHVSSDWTWASKRPHRCMIRPSWVLVCECKWVWLTTCSLTRGPCWFETRAHAMYGIDWHLMYALIVWCASRHLIEQTYCMLYVLALNVRTYCMLYSLAFNVHTYCMLYDLALNVRVYCILYVLALNVCTYYMLYVLTLNVHTYCMLYDLALKNST